MTLYPPSSRPFWRTICGKSSCGRVLIVMTWILLQIFSSCASPGTIGSPYTPFCPFSQYFNTVRPTHITQQRLYLQHAVQSPRKPCADLLFADFASPQSHTSKFNHTSSEFYWQAFL